MMATIHTAIAAKHCHTLDSAEGLEQPQQKDICILVWGRLFTRTYRAPWLAADVCKA
jgi:hypothetical protein